MSVKYVRPHIQRMKKFHEQHKKQILQIVHAIRRHPGAYQPGYKPSRASMPKSFPRKPAGLHKEASGFWDFAKKGWEWVKGKFNKHKGAVIDHAKKVAVRTAGRVASRVGSAASRVGNRVIDKIEQVAENNIDPYVSKAEDKIDSMGKRAEAKLQKWDKPKKGSGVIMDSLARQAGQAVRAFRQGRAGRGGLGFNPKQMVYTTRRGPIRRQTVGGVTRLLGRRGVPQRTE